MARKTLVTTRSLGVGLVITFSAVWLLYTWTTSRSDVNRAVVHSRVHEWLENHGMSVEKFELEPCKYAQPIEEAREMVQRLPARQERALFAVPIGKSNANQVDALVSHFLESNSFDIWLFCYDDSCSHWDSYEWSSNRQVRLIETTGLKKWQIAFQEMEPGIQLVDHYSHIFFWDDDMELDAGFDAEHFLRFLQWGSIKLSQPAVSSGILHYRQGRDKGNTGLMKSIKQVEIQVPIYSRETWDCVYDKLDSTTATGYGIDDYVHTCVCGVTEMFQINFMTVSHSNTKSLDKSGSSEEKKALKGRIPGFDEKACFSRWNELPIQQYCMEVEFARI